MSEPGRVKWFIERKGYGFIERSNGGEIFVPFSSIQGDGFKTLVEGELVRFDLMETPKRLHAVRVVREVSMIVGNVGSWVELEGEFLRDPVICDRGISREFSVRLTQDGPDVHEQHAGALRRRRRGLFQSP
jgi:CspA family cold shock protein